MRFDSVKALKEMGFAGFKTVGDLANDYAGVPGVRGVYLVLYLGNTRPKFNENGTGGFFKGKNPNVDVQTLKASWVDNTIVIYIGQAGGIRGGHWSKNTLSKRIKSYLRFGQGKNTAHYGGRYIWQMADSRNLVVCWKALPDQQKDPKKMEGEMIQAFNEVYGKLPYANLSG